MVRWHLPARRSESSTQLPVSVAAGLGGQAERMTSSLEDLDTFDRFHVVGAGVRALITAALLVTLYFVLPVENRPHQSVVLRLAVALTLFVVVLANEIRLISSHERPMLRAGVAMATIIPLFLVVFAWIYLTMARAYPASFNVPLNRISALYFTVTVFSTVGFGDITPKTDVSRLVVTIQMLSDLAVVAVAIRLILGAATRGRDREKESTE
jgi:voltage-gated potassium channel